jgi:hypothetical protein
VSQNYVDFISMREELAPGHQAVLGEFEASVSESLGAEMSETAPKSLAEELAEKYCEIKYIPVSELSIGAGMKIAKRNMVAAINEALERAAQTVENERVDEEDTGDTEDIAYNCALQEAARAVRALKSK